MNVENISEMLDIIDNTIEELELEKSVARKEVIISKLKKVVSKVLKKSKEKFLAVVNKLGVTQDLKALDKVAKEHVFIENNKEFKEVKPLLSSTFTIGYSKCEEKCYKEFVRNKIVKDKLELKFSGMRAASVEGYTKNRTADLIVDLDTSTRDKVRATIQSSMKEMEDYEKCKERLVDNYAFSSARAETIARTETGRGYNIGFADAAEASGVIEGLAVEDGDDDEPCAEANGSEWSFDEARENPLEHPNCTREFYPIFSDDLFPQDDELRKPREQISEDEE